MKVILAVQTTMLDVMGETKLPEDQVIVQHWQRDDNGKAISGHWYRKKADGTYEGDIIREDTVFEIDVVETEDGELVIVEQRVNSTPGSPPAVNER